VERRLRQRRELLLRHTARREDGEPRVGRCVGLLAGEDPGSVLGGGGPWEGLRQGGLRRSRALRPHQCAPSGASSTP
jgi:hypothetical protein